MTAPKHTPGPWTAKDYRDGDFHVSILAPIRGRGISGHETIAQLGIFWLPEHGAAGQHQALERATANARLISAAPDLLAACEDMMCLYSCGLHGPIPDGWGEQTRNVLLGARAAIAKARGEA